MNVLIYVLDALRADHLSCYGYERETTPILDGIAANGVRFERCFTPATWTRPVAASILSGLYPPAHGTRTREDVFAPPRRSLAEQFRTADFETFGVTTMGNVASATGFNRGFDLFRDLYRDEEIIAKRTTSSADKQELKNKSGEIAIPRAEDINTTVEAWLQDRSDKDPFFAFCWSIEPHEPYEPPAGYEYYRDPTYDGPVDGSTESLKHVETAPDLDHLKALYDEEIKYNDDCIGNLLNILEDAGELEDTLLVFVGDHGEAFNEHGRLTHGHTPHEEVAHVPCIVRPPANEEEEITGHEVSELINLVDLYPTVISYATERNVAVDPRIGGIPVDGALRAEAISGRDMVYFDTQAYDMRSRFAGLRTDQWKYISIDPPDQTVRDLLQKLRYVWDQNLLWDILRNPGYYWQRYRYDETDLLYDLDADDSERENVAEAYPEQCGTFTMELQSWYDACTAFRNGHDQDYDQSAEVDEQTKEQLRRLGYSE